MKKVIEDKIWVISLLISALILLFVTVLFNDVAVGLVLAIVSLPVSNYFSKKVCKK